MKLVIIFGPAAVGKMSVGKALADITDMKLFHNHMSIEAIRPIFDFGTPQFNRLVSMIRFETFKEVAKSDLEGLIFTFVWALDLPEEHKYVDRIVNIFEAENAEVFYVELEADTKTRLIRNKGETRLLEKPSKRNFEQSERALLQDDRDYQLNTKEGEFKRPNHLKINNEELEPEEVASRVVEHFNFLN